MHYCVSSFFYVKQPRPVCHPEERRITQVARQSLSWHTDDTDLLCKDADKNGFFYFVILNVPKFREKDHTSSSTTVYTQSICHPWRRKDHTSRSTIVYT